MSNHKFKDLVDQGIDYEDFWRGDYGQPACRDVDPIDWAQAEQDLTAHFTCNRCPCQTECLYIALNLEASSTTSKRFGCWGGFYPFMRYKIYKQWLKTHQPIDQLISQEAL